MSADVDIDFADRKQILDIIRHTPARQENSGAVRKHNSGVFVTDIPIDPINNTSSIDYREAEQRGYFKIDFLNQSVYESIRDQAHRPRRRRRPLVHGARGAASRRLHPGVILA